MRPATPPRFKYEIYRNSIVKLQTLPAERMCFGHFGLYENVPEILNNALNQLDLWWETVCSMVKESPDIREEVVLERLFAIDPQLQNYTVLPADKQQREHYFMINSLKGMLEAARVS